MIAALLLCGGCGTARGDSQAESEEEQASNSGYSVYDESVQQTLVGSYEAEDGSFTGGVKAGSIQKGYTGTGYAEGLAKDGDSCTVTIDIPEDGFYDLDFISRPAGAGEHKENNIAVDGEPVGTAITESKSFDSSVVERVYLTAGEHSVTMSKSWGWVLWDSLQVYTSKVINQAIYDVASVLSNPNPSKSAQNLYNYICDIYGKQILSGQVCTEGGEIGKEMKVVRDTVGKTPAILGLDMSGYSPTSVANGAVTQDTQFAKKFWQDGGIVTIFWHWTIPEQYVSGQWYSSFYKEHVGHGFDLARIMSGEDPEGHDALMSDIDAIAEQLVILRDAGVPVLWRPLHEAAGGWFWWGAYGADAYKKLYIEMYDKLTNEYGLNNLIWIWNGQDAGWYPGDEYVDIIGWDVYAGERVYSSQAATFLEAAKCPKTAKPIWLSENGTLFDPDLAKRDGTLWGAWCTWEGEFVLKSGPVWKLSEQYTEEAMLKQVYENPLVITMDELPKL